MAASIVQTSTGGGTLSPDTATWTSTPVAGHTLVAIVNSATVATTPSGWTVRSSMVQSQGFYVYDKVAGASEPAFTIATSGDFPTAITLIELAGVTGFDVASTGDVETAGVITGKTIASATSTGTTGDFLIDVIAVHGFGSLPNTPTWGNGFAALVTVPPQGTTGNGVMQFVGTRTQGTSGAIGATTVSWVNAADNVFGVQLAYTVAGPTGAVTAVPARGSATANAPLVSNGNPAIAAPPARGGGSSPAPQVSNGLALSHLFTTQTPTNVEPGTDVVPYVFGLQFAVTADGMLVRAVRYYKTASSAWNGRSIQVGLWDEDASTLLSSASRTQLASDAVGWVDVPLSAAIPISPGTNYVAAYLNPGGGHYGFKPTGLAATTLNPPLAAGGTSGRLASSSTLALPTSQSQTNFFVDVSVAATPPVPPTAPPLNVAVTAPSPAVDIFTGLAIGGGPAAAAVRVPVPTIGGRVITPTGWYVRRNGQWVFITT